MFLFGAGVQKKKIAEIKSISSSKSIKQKKLSSKQLSSQTSSNGKNFNDIDEDAFAQF